MSETTAKLSIQIEAKVAEAQQAVNGLVTTVKGYGTQSTASSKEAANATADHSRQVKALQKDLELLGKIEAFGKLKKDTKEAQQAWEAATAKVATLAREMKATEAPTKKLSDAMEKAKRNAGLLKDNFELQRNSLNGVRTALSQAGINSTKLSSAQSELKRRIAETTTAAEASRRKIAELGATTATVEKNSLGLGAAWGKLAGAWVAFQGVIAAGGLIGMIEDMQRLEARLLISEGSARKAALALAEIKRIAQETRVPVKEVADAYIRFSTAIQRAGGSQKESIKFTENLSKALKVSGASADTSARVMLQLGQAFDSGRLQGDEFRSVAENGGMVLNYMADALKITRGELRKMSMDGTLTTEKMLKFNEAGEAINRDFAKIPRTAGDAFTQLKNTFVDITSSSTTLKLALQGLALILESTAQNFSLMFGMAAVALITSMIVSVGGLAAAFEIVAGAVLSVKAALFALKASNPELLVLTAILTYVIWQWEKLSNAWYALLDVFGMKPESVATDDMREQLSDVEKQINDMQAKVGPALAAVTAKINDTRKAAEKSMKGVISAYSEIAGQIENSAKDQVATVKDRYDAEKRMIDETQAKSDGRYIAEARALITATQEQLQIMRDAAGQKIALLDNEAGLRRTAIDVMFDNERERAQALQELDSEILSKKRGVLAEMLSDYRSHVDNLNAQAQRHFDAVKAIEDQKAQLTMSAEDKIRAYQQSTMGEYQAYQDRVLQVDEALSKSRAALVAGDSQLAQEYAKKAMDATGQIASAVKEDGKEVLSQAQAAATAIAKVEEAKNLGLQAMTQLQTKQTEAGNALQGQAVTLGQTMQQISADIAVVNGQLSTGAQFTIQSNAAQVRADVEALNALITEREVLMTIQTNIDELKEKADSLKERLEKSTAAEHIIDDNADKVQSAINQLKRDTESTHTIYIRRVEKNASGGWAGWAGKAQKLASGGRAWKRIVGRVRGAGTAMSDSIRAMLSNGEFVLRERATRLASRFMPGFVERLNAITSHGDLQRLLGNFSVSMAAPALRLATGGPVNMPVTGGSLGSMNVNFRVGDMEIPIQVTGPNAKQQVRTLVKQLNREKLVAGV